MGRLLSVNVGLPRDIKWKGPTVHTGIWKDPVLGRCRVLRLNLDGDGQGDLAGHGGRAARLSMSTSEKCGHQDGHQAAKLLRRKELVPKKGLEPPHPCGYMDLNLSWLAGVSGAGARWRNPERSRRTQELLVPKKGLEPPHPCGYMDLNHARLPIPPLRHWKGARRKPSAATGNDSYYSIGWSAFVKISRLIEAKVIL